MRALRNLRESTKQRKINSYKFIPRACCLCRNRATIRKTKETNSSTTAHIDGQIVRRPCSTQSAEHVCAHTDSLSAYVSFFRSLNQTTLPSTTSLHEKTSERGANTSFTYYRFGLRIGLPPSVSRVLMCAMNAYSPSHRIQINLM